MSKERIRVGVLGASGYTGADLVRLAMTHPNLEIALMTADRHAGKPMQAVFPHLGPQTGKADLPNLVTVAEADWDACDVAVCGLPHGTTQEIVAGLPGHLKIADMSADFRLRDTGTYAEWYGHEHRAPHLQPEAVYGLTEYYRDAVAAARLVACPGCYPTAALLLLLPVVGAGLIDPADIVIDAKSGTSGAGRGLKEGTLFCEVAEGIHPYGVASHRHAPEIEQEVSLAAGREVLVNFTPHLMPMNRGELLTTYVRLNGGATAADLRACLEARYASEPFVHVAPEGMAPATRHVRGSNHVLLQVYADRLPGRAILVSTLDNLVKGSSGQAIQNINLMFGLPETTGLEQAPLFP
ncbi:MAG: N-acetyl-gamma-glutamyl-phosphate reductase [Rhodospirillaceae bacterium]|nr:N-acetyl-gamma-glutamyl-phosphate reductase [Rhodospirillaceae bacterium]MYB14399.1 N-acetyl-gamma-glutamyl-phosphate reductase [Rhodospirillaceae bacterium]MYI49626.1 N-acetyl-gamma-glutamyl-phosphate reductase [Rhodospirillaceae bacterium]